MVPGAGSQHDPSLLLGPWEAFWPSFLLFRWGNWKQGQRFEMMNACCTHSAFSAPQAHQASAQLVQHKIPWCVSSDSSFSLGPHSRQQTSWRARALISMRRWCGPAS